MANQHVTPRPDGRWQVKREGSPKATVITNTQRESISIATGFAKNQQSEVFIHGVNGRIRERNSYGSDPFPPRG